MIELSALRICTSVYLSCSFFFLSNNSSPDIPGDVRLLISKIISKSSSDNIPLSMTKSLTFLFSLIASFAISDDNL